MIRLVHSKKFLDIRKDIFPKMASRNKLQCIAQLLNEAETFAEIARKSGLSDAQLDWLNSKLVNVAERLDLIAENCRIQKAGPRVNTQGGDATPDTFHGTKPEVY